MAQLDPLAHGPVQGLIASPPCQSFSRAGSQKGRQDKADVLACAHELALGHDTRSERLPGLQDPRSLLTVEPLRWAIDLKPEWLAFEQVPTVLELWTHFASLLELHGYHVDTGVLSSEQYGLPQTRKRAFLIANRLRPVHLPQPTHPAFRKGDSSGWVSMAQALRWPDGYVGFPRRADAGRPSIELDGQHYRARDLRSTSEPAFAVTEKARSWTLTTADGSRPVTEAETSTLMGFRPSYPWHGSRTKRFHQIGNAVCPPLAAAVIDAAMGTA